MHLPTIALLGIAIAATPCLAQEPAGGKARAASSTSQSPTELIASARALLSDDDGLEAIPLLDKALAATSNLTPDMRAEAVYLRGVAFYKENNAVAALRDLSEAASWPQLAEPMRKSASAAISLLAHRVASFSGGVDGEGYSYQVRLTLDDLRQREKAIEENRSESEPETRAEEYADLAHEYASRTQFDVAQRLAAKSLAEAKASGSGFRLAAVHMTYYELAQMRDDYAAAAVSLARALDAFESSGALRTAPGILSDLIGKAESRGDSAETCRHRKNLDAVYTRIGGADLAGDVADNIAAMKRQNCPAT